MKITLFRFLKMSYVILRKILTQKGKRERFYFHNPI